jgi:phosphoglycolate phosphatase-like HAD superfamily hydrolase
MIRAMIFDLDGTLVKTEQLKALSYARAAVEPSFPRGPFKAGWIVDDPARLATVVQQMARHQNGASRE